MGVVPNVFAGRMRMNVCAVVVGKIVRTRRSEVGILNLLQSDSLKFMDMTFMLKSQLQKVPLSTNIKALSVVTFQAKEQQLNTLSSVPVRHIKPTINQANKA